MTLFLVASVVSRGLATAAKANHSDPKPNGTLSWYMTNVNHTTHFDAGCDHGNRIEAFNDPWAALTILTYGDPLEITAGTFGTDLFNSPSNATTAQVRTAAEQFAFGMDSCMPETLEDVLDIVIILGVTNNFPGPWGTGKSRDHGEKWAAMVKSANDYLYNSGRISFMQFAGGYDVELGRSDPGQARAWANGYESSTSSYRLYTFGAPRAAARSTTRIPADSECVEQRPFQSGTTKMSGTSVSGETPMLFLRCISRMRSKPSSGSCSVSMAGTTGLEFPESSTSWDRLQRQPETRPLKPGPKW